MNIPASLKYTKEHEWARVEGNKVYIGITDYAQHTLGDVVFIELPQVGDEFRAGEVFGVIESVKAVSDLYCPVSGLVKEVNEALLASPELINKTPYENWIISMEMSNSAELNNLLDAVQYNRLCSNEGRV